MGIQLHNWVENILGKGEIARYEQFLLFPQCFQKMSIVDVSDWISMEWRVNQKTNFGIVCIDSIYLQATTELLPLGRVLFDRVEYIVEKGENACNHHVSKSIFVSVFLTAAVP